MNRRLLQQRKRRARGAALIEAIIVIVFLILAFTGLVFFHRLYLNKVRTTRVSRAATLHNAITFCKTDVRTELATAGGTSTALGGFLGNDIPYNQNPGANMSSVATSAAGNQSGVSSSLGAKIVHITNDGQAQASGGGNVFKGKTTSTSYVGCADPVSDEQFGEIIPRVKNAISF